MEKLLRKLNEDLLNTIIQKYCIPNCNLHIQNITIDHSHTKIDYSEITEEGIVQKSIKFANDKYKIKE